MWWLLVEYDDEYDTQGWKGFADEAALKEFAETNVTVGEPLEIPPVSLSPEESATVVSFCVLVTCFPPFKSLSMYCRVLEGFRVSVFFFCVLSCLLLFFVFL